jgi:hypothetical protein
MEHLDFPTFPGSISERELAPVNCSIEALSSIFTAAMRVEENMVCISGHYIAVEIYKSSEIRGPEKIIT